MRRIAAAAVFKNPYAGLGAVDDHGDLTELSLQVGELVTRRGWRRCIR